MGKIPLLIFLAVLAIQTFAQEKPVAIKFGEVENGKEFTPLFIKQFDEFLKKVRKAPNSTRGFVAIDADDLSILSARHDIVEAKLRKRADLRRRIEVTHRGVSYRTHWTKSEFWFVPGGAKAPYLALTADVFCPIVTVQGKPAAADTKEEIVFTASVGSDGPVGFKWSVVGGHISSGQGTPRISVKIGRSMRVGVGMGVTATLKLTGLPEDGNCMDKFSYTTMLAPIPNID